MGEIFVMDLDGSNLVNLTNNGSHDAAPAWSPDGTKIAFYATRDGNGEIYVMDADGSNPTRLTNQPAVDYAPEWSPDGLRIVYQSDVDGDREIFVMDADGSNKTQLTFNAAHDSEPAWSPDGAMIAFASEQDGNGEIYVMSPDGSSVVRLTNNGATDGGVTWSPDSGRIAFHSERDGNPEIYVMDADGSNQVRLTVNAVLDQSPVWSPLQAIEIPDPDLEAAIRDALAMPMRDLTSADLESLTSLNAATRNIADLSGLEYCTNLTGLYLGWNNLISDLSPLAGLTQLVQLHLGYSQITDLTPLSGMASLTGLWLQVNQITDLTPLAGLTGLVEVDLSGNAITSLSPVTGWTQLSGASLGDNQISDLTPLSGLAQLTALNLRSNQVSDLSLLAGLGQLRQLWMEYNQISDLTPLASLGQLELLDVHGNQIGSLNGLGGLASLAHLDVRDNGIADLSPLAPLTQLTHLLLGSNQVGSLTPLAGMTSLRYLDGGTNQVSDVAALTGLTSLEELYLGSNQISDLSPMTGLTQLTKLHAHGNQVGDLAPLIHNAGLGTGDDLRIESNPLTAHSITQLIPVLLSRGVASLVWEPHTNQPPVVTSTPVAEATTGDVYEYAVGATDSESDVLEYSLVDYPSGMAIHPSTGDVQWVPGDTDVGEHSVGVQVTDGVTGHEITQDYLLQVTVNHPPALAPIGDQEAAIGATLQLVLSATDPDGDELTFSVAGNREGSSLIGNVFTWPPADGQPSIDNITFTVQDPRGASASETIAIIGPAFFAILLEPGWNLVALAKPTIDNTVAAVTEEIRDNLTIVVGFETAAINPNGPRVGGKLYTPTLPDFITTLDLVDPRLGYWIKMSAHDILYSDSPPAKVMAMAQSEDSGGRGLHPVYDFMGVWGTLTTDGSAAPKGTIVDVLDGDGNLAGRCEVHHPGYYGFLALYRDNPDTEIDEGAETGEWLSVLVDGQPVDQMIEWTEFGDVVQVDLEAVSPPVSPLPTASALMQNYPNPFNPSTTISYQLARDEEVVLSIWNLAGQLIRELVHTRQVAGHYSVTWDGRDSAGSLVANGVYLYEIRARDFRAARRMVLMK